LFRSSGKQYHGTVLAIDTKNKYN